MITTPSTRIEVGTQAPSFNLPDTRNNQSVSLSQFEGKPLLIAFICNHCPYVVHLVDELALAADAFALQGVSTVAISANDAVAYPADSPENMAKLAATKGFNFPYCYDESQQTARDYNAVCTPDLYLFDQTHALYYRGQFDASRPGSGRADGRDLKKMVAAMLAKQDPPTTAHPSVGCSIKWKS